MDAIHLARRGRPRRRVGHACDGSGAGHQHDPGLPRGAFEDREHRMRGCTARDREPNIQPLRHRDREAAGRYRLDAKPVYRDQLAAERAEIEVEIAHCRPVDDTQQHAAARLDLHDIGVGERTVIGEKRVIGDIIEVGGGGARFGRHRHAAHATAHRGGVVARHPGHFFGFRKLA